MVNYSNFYISFLKFKTIDTAFPYIIKNDYLIKILVMEAK